MTEKPAATYVNLSNCEFRREAYTDDEWEVLQLWIKKAKDAFDGAEELLKKDENE